MTQLLIADAWICTFIFLYFAARWITGRLAYHARVCEPDRGPSRALTWCSRVVFRGLAALSVTTLPVLLTLVSTLAWPLLGPFTLWLAGVYGAALLVIVVRDFLLLLVEPTPDGDGVELLLHEHPRLRLMLLEITDRLGVPPIARVLLTHKTEHAFFPASRTLVIAAPDLDCLDVTLFEAHIALLVGNGDSRIGLNAVSWAIRLLNRLRSDSMVFFAYDAFTRTLLEASRGAWGWSERCNEWLAADACGTDTLLELYASAPMIADRRHAWIRIAREMVDTRIAATNLWEHTATSPVIEEELDAFCDVLTIDISSKVRWAIALAMPSLRRDERSAWSVFSDREALETRITAAFVRVLRDDGFELAPFAAHPHLQLAPVPPVVFAIDWQLAPHTRH